MSAMFRTPRIGSSRTIFAGVIMALLSAGSFAAVSAPAAGAVSQDQAVLSPKCKVWEQTVNKFSGWCDGRGPASFRATITCSGGGGENQGQWRWLGDRRGSTAWCSPGHFRVASKFQFRT